MINAEILGMVATVIVLLSFLVKGEIKIRFINMFGAMLFVIYGLQIGATSVWVLNGILTIIQLYNVRKMNRQQPSTNNI